MPSSPQIAVTPQRVADGDPVALTRLVERRARAVIAFCETVCTYDVAPRAAAEAFARFRAAVYAAADPRGLDPETLLRGATRHAAGALARSASTEPRRRGLNLRLDDPLRCIPTPGLLAARADNMLGAAEDDELSAHLQRCAGCRAVEARFNRAEQAYSRKSKGEIEAQTFLVILEALHDAAPIEERYLDGWDDVLADAADAAGEAEAEAAEEVVPEPAAEAEPEDEFEAEEVPELELHADADAEPEPDLEAALAPAPEPGPDPESFEEESTALYPLDDGYDTGPDSDSDHDTDSDYDTDPDYESDHYYDREPAGLAVATAPLVDGTEVPRRGGAPFGSVLIAGAISRARGRGRELPRPFRHTHHEVADHGLVYRYVLPGTALLVAALIILAVAGVFSAGGP